MMKNKMEWEKSFRTHAESMKGVPDNNGWDFYDLSANPIVSIEEMHPGYPGVGCKVHLQDGEIFSFSFWHGGGFWEMARPGRKTEIILWERFARENKRRLDSELDVLEKSINGHNHHPTKDAVSKVLWSWQQCEDYHRNHVLNSVMFLLS